MEPLRKPFRSLPPTRQLMDSPRRQRRHQRSRLAAQRTDPPTPPTRTRFHSTAHPTAFPDHADKPTEQTKPRGKAPSHSQAPIILDPTRPRTPTTQDDVAPGGRSARPPGPERLEAAGHPATPEQRPATRAPTTRPHNHVRTRAAHPNHAPLHATTPPQTTTAA